jgi:hypothetical protein
MERLTVLNYKDIDGVQGKAKIAEAVEHDFTIVETAKGKTARIKDEESELF